MTLGEVDLAIIDAAIRKWNSVLPLRILHHKKKCCSATRGWIISMDQSMIVGSDVLSGPTWIRKKYKWGPSRSPIYWCDLVKVDTFNCGALAALAREVLKARGLRVFPVQMIQKFSRQDVHHWQRVWRVESLDWVLDTLAYHEGCAVVVKGRHVKIWDPVDNRWVPPPWSQGYGTTLALRIISQRTHGSVVWGHYEIKFNVWKKLVVDKLEGH